MARFPDSRIVHRASASSQADEPSDGPEDRNEGPRTRRSAAPRLQWRDRVGIRTHFAWPPGSTVGVPCDRV